MRAKLIVLVAALLAIAAPAVASEESNDSGNTETLQWAGNGSENADPGCQKDQASAWHWILTPGGNNVIQEATLNVSYESGATDTAQGATRSGERGAFHFDLTRPQADSVATGSVSFIYQGEGGNFVLTISDSSCVASNGDNGDDDKDDGDDDKEDEERVKDEELDKDEDESKDDSDDSSTNIDRDDDDGDDKPTLKRVETGGAPPASQLPTALLMVAGLVLFFSTRLLTQRR